METLKYSQIFKEDLSLGTGTREITLADGRVVTLSQIRITDLPSTFTAGSVLFASSTGAATEDTSFTYDDTNDILSVRGLTVNRRLMLTQGTAIASASTITIPTDGNFFSVTGNTGITAIGASSLQAGTIFFLKFSGTPTITHNSTTLILQDGLNLTLTAGTIIGFISLGSGNVQEIFRAGQTVTGALPQGYRNGLVISRSAATTLGITTGVCRDGTDAQNMALTSAYTKTSSAWAVGSGAGGLLSGTFAASTRFYVFVIFRSDTKVTDIGFEASATPTLPTNYTHSRVLGSFLTNSSSEITNVTEAGDYSGFVGLNVAGFHNIGVAVAVSANALTVTFKGADGRDLATANPGTVFFSSILLTEGLPSFLTLTANVTITVPDTATLGTSNGTLARIYFGLQNDTGTARACVFNTQTGSAGSFGVAALPHESALHSATAIGVASDNSGTLYASAATTSMPIRWAGYFEASEATAGTWATAPTVIRALHAGIPRSGAVIQRVSSSYATQTTNDTSTYADTGLSLAITPGNACNRVLARIEQAGLEENTNAGYIYVKLVRGSTDLRENFVAGTVGSAFRLPITYLDAPASAAATTYKTQFKHGSNNAQARVQNGSQNSDILLEEIFS